MRVRIQTDNGQTGLSFTLNSPTGVVGFSHQEIPGHSRYASLEEFKSNLLGKIEKLGERLDIDGAFLLREDIEHKLVSLGRDLWRLLFPPQLQAAYRDIRRNVRSWLIVSEEPWIPWELVKPYDPSHEPEPIDDDFLSLKFELTRWLSGNRVAPPNIAVRNVVALRTAFDLPHSSQEVSLFKNLARSHQGIQDVTPAGIVSPRSFLDLLSTANVDLIHVIGHGSLEAANSDEAGIPFPDGRLLRPSDLQGPLATSVGTRRPLVFLNVCGGGQQGWSLTSLGGWAARWVGVCGAGAFIAPMWSVRDRVATTFAQAFYSALAQGETLGQAALGARRLAWQQDAGPSALGYVVYGHPETRVVFGEETGFGDSSADIKQAPPIPPVSLPSPWVAEPVASRRDLSASVPPTGLSRAQSSHLRIKRQFTDRDRDDFVEQSFEVIAEFFEASLAGLERENTGVEGKFRRVDANHFTAIVFVQGDKRCSCRVWMGNTSFGDIAYAEGDRGRDNSLNEALSVENDGYSMWWKPILGLAFIDSSNRKPMTALDAAQYLWGRLIYPLQ